MARRQVNLYINGREVKNTIKDITAEKRKLVRELNRMVVGSEEYNAQLAEIKGLNKNIKEHREALRPVASSYEKMTGALKGFAAVALASFSVDAIISYGKELFKLGSEMELLGKKAQTVFGQALPLVTKEAERNAIAMGLTISAYTDAAAAIGDLLVPMGFQREEAANISTQLVNLSGALSEWTGGQITAEQASNALSKALLGEREELKSLGIAISEADVQNRLAEKGLDNLTGKLLEQAKATATLELILEKSTDAQAAFAQNSDTLVRKQAELNAQLNQIRETLATALFPIFQRLVSVAVQLADGIADVIENITGVGTASNSAATSVARLQKEFNIEIETLARGNLSAENRRELIDQINIKYKDYLPNLLKETDSLDDLRTAQELANDAFRERITLLAAQEAFQKVQAELIKAKARELELQVELTRAQERFNTAADAGRQIVGANDRAQRQAVAALEDLNNAKDAVEENIEAQKRLEDQYVALQEAARQANINLFPTDTTQTEGDTPAPTFTPPPEVVEEEITRYREAIDELIELEILKAEQVQSITLESEQERTRIELEESKKRLLNTKKSNEELIAEQRAQAEALVQVSRGISAGIGGALALLGEDQRQFTALGKGLALANVAIKSAEAIATATAASAGVPFPGNLAAIATAVGAVLANIAQASAILNNTQVPQRFMGGEVTVQGAQDGRTYRANYLGRPGTGLLPGGPALVDTIGGPILANERGREYFVAWEDLRNPVVLDHVRAIENIRLARTGRLASTLPQRQEGGAVTGDPAGISTAGSSPGMDGALVSQLIQVNQALLAAIERGVVAIVPDDTVEDIFDRAGTLSNVRDEFS